MVVGTCVIQLYIPENNSLKGKRQVVNSIKGRVRSRFNVSIAEVGDTELWQRASLAIAYVNKNKREVDSLLDKILNFIEDMHKAQIVGCERELLHYHLE